MSATVMSQSTSTTQSILGEGALTLWLLIMGVNASRWRNQAVAAAG